MTPEKLAHMEAEIRGLSKLRDDIIRLQKFVSHYRQYPNDDMRVANGVYGSGVDVSVTRELKQQILESLENRLKELQKEFDQA